MEIDTRMAVAAFRWNIIGPLVVPGLSGEERRRYRRQVLQSDRNVGRIFVADRSAVAAPLRWSSSGCGPDRKV